MSTAVCFLCFCIEFFKLFWTIVLSDTSVNTSFYINVCSMKWNHIFKNDSNIYRDDSGQGALLTSNCKRNFCPEMWWWYSKKKKAFLDSKHEVKKVEKQPITVHSVSIPRICSHDKITFIISLNFDNMSTK